MALNGFEMLIKSGKINTDNSIKRRGKDVYYVTGNYI